MVPENLLKTGFQIAFGYEWFLIHWYKAAFPLRFAADFEFGKSINLIQAKSINCHRQVKLLIQPLGLAELRQQHLRHVSAPLLESVESSPLAREDPLGADPIEKDKALVASL